MNLFVGECMIIIPLQMLRDAERANPQLIDLGLLRDLGKVSDAEFFEAYQAACAA